MLVGILGVVSILMGTLLFLAQRDQLSVLKGLVLIIMIILFTVALLLLATILIIVLLWYNRTVPKGLISVVSFSIRQVYPIMLFAGKLLNFDKNAIRRAYTLLNNRIIKDKEYNLKGEEVLVLTPHCLQKSICPHKITNDVENCKLCGQCNIHQLMKLKERYGNQFRVVTGGTLARKLILETRPKAIIAIACERDLVSGLQDVKGIPVLAVINQRPNGPCVNTLVDLEEVEIAIRHFIKE